MEVDESLADALGVEGESHAVVLVVDHEGGVRRFEAGLTAPEGVAVAAVAPGDVADTFEVTAGGEGADRVEARAVDFVGSGRTPPVVLFGVRFSGAVDPAAVGFTARRLVDHDEGEVDGGAVRVAAAERA